VSRWFRFYAEAMRNPKVMRLSDADYRLWTKMLCVASENDGVIPPVGDLKLILAVRLDHLEGGLNRLIRGLLITPLDRGYQPHNWDRFQYKSDTSNDRVTKHRAKCNVTVTPPETETEQSISDAKASSPQRPKAVEVLPYPRSFDRFWEVCPKKIGKRATYQAWKRAGKRLGGGLPAANRMAEAMKAYAAHAPPNDQGYTVHPSKWLNEGRYDDPIQEHASGNHLTHPANDRPAKLAGTAQYRAASRYAQRHGTRTAGN
jgi:hypothetical protein